jgi:hypothetical protein
MQDMAEREAAGESFWTEGFSQKVRRRIRHAYDNLGYSFLDSSGECFTDARRMILEQEGDEFLSASAVVPYRDFELFLIDAPDDMYPTALEALVIAIDNLRVDEDFYGPPPTDGFSSRLRNAVNEVFSQERVAWKLVQHEMVEMKSQELHEALVEPALRLIHDARFARVDATYRKSLKELSSGDGADAVTDSGTALQELLTELGCDGNQLGDLIRSARKKEILAAHDASTLDALEKAMHWVAADRSETGDSHHASEASREDAWLIVHIVGAFIVRLASGGKRPSA